MKDEFIPALLELTEIMQDMELVGLKHGVTYYYWIVKKFDPSRQDEINSVCNENGLVWNVLPAPLLNTNGTKTTTGTKLTKLSYKRRPIEKGMIPQEIIRAKIIVHEKGKIKRG